MKRMPLLKYVLAAAISLSTFAVYLLSLRNGFVEWDDSTYILENPFIRSFNPSFLKWAFFHFYASNWHPLTWISHALDYAVWGLNPLGHHLTNNILHAANTFVVVLLVTRWVGLGNPPSSLRVTPPPPAPPLKIRGGRGSYEFTGGGGFSNRWALIAAGVTGLLFGLHPLHVESVAWVAERKDLLCAFFFLLSVMAYTKYATNTLQREKGMAHRVKNTFALAPNSLLCTLCLFILALMSKPMAVSLPVIMLILDWYPFRRIRSVGTFWAVLAEKVPFLVLSLIASVITVLAQRAGGAIASVEAIPLPDRMLVAARSLVSYLWKMAVPLNLNPFYPYPRNIAPLSMEYVLPLVLVVGITVACIVAAREGRRLWLSAWGCYVISLVPVLGFVQVGDQSMADRYTYIPSIGPFLLAGLAAAWALGRASTVRQRRPAVAFIGIASAVLLIAMSYSTVRQIAVWRNSLALWDYVISKVPEKVPVVYYNRGIALKKMGQLADATEDFDMAIAIDPSFFKAYNYRGIIYGEAGAFDLAIKCFNKAIAINPGYAKAYANRGYTYGVLGSMYTALQDLNKAIELDQDFANAYFTRGNIYLGAGNKGLALSDYVKACELGNSNACDALRLRLNEHSLDQ